MCRKSRLSAAIAILVSIYTFASSSQSWAAVPPWQDAQQDQQNDQSTAPLQTTDAAPPAAPAPDQPAQIQDPPPAAQPSDPASAAQPDESLTNQPADAHFIHDFVGDFLHDEYRTWTGPFHAHNYDSHTMKKYGLPFLLISGALLATDRETARWLPNTSNQVLWSGRVSQIGAPYTVAGAAGAYYLIGRFTGNQRARETGFLALEAVAESQFLGLIFKEVTQRERPIANNIRSEGWWQGGNSFPSGHALGSFAIAAVFSYEYNDHIVVPITAFSLATLVDLSRLGARQHWYSDVFIGSAAGFLIGRYVYKNHHDPDLPGSPVVPHSRLRPDLEAGDQGLGLYWKF